MACFSSFLVYFGTVQHCLTSVLWCLSTISRPSSSVPQLYPYSRVAIRDAQVCFLHFGYILDCLATVPWCLLTICLLVSPSCLSTLNDHFEALRSLLPHFEGISKLSHGVLLLSCSVSLLSLSHLWCPLAVS